MKKLHPRIIKLTIVLLTFLITGGTIIALTRGNPGVDTGPGGDSGT
jgi:hypothetical protein